MTTGKSVTNGPKGLGFFGKYLSLWVILCILAGIVPEKVSPGVANYKEVPFPFGVCPPFYLRDEGGNVIDPIHKINADKPYSPKQTCGKCHDYKKITEGFHFQQGRGEKPTPDMQKRYLWVTSPGNYGGNWCSPAPLYRSLALKINTNPRMIDMTSFEFVTATCGNCHPGGGPLEYDRDGHRYDQYMKEQGMLAGGDNGLDGDYFKARWSETGVIEADCLLCHMPEYDYQARNKQLAELNFRWASSAGARFAQVNGSIKEGKPVSVVYDKNLFDEEGKVSPHLVREPTNETCLNCHAKPDWKKKGASYTTRTDVHIKAGLRCIDCHASGSKAVDRRIRGKEVHQFGKGDDPSGHVRDDLDNTMRQCADCHSSGYLGAPVAKHNGLPPLHLQKIACQTCHIPWRYVKSAQVQVSDVFNPGPKIDPPAKHIWTFYDAEMKYWNHYGELNMFTNKNQPTNPYRPVLGRYKGKIFPVNRVHSSWPALIEEGKPGLNQPFMKDVFMMWKVHNENPSKYPELSKIHDDNGDGVPEVNRSEEIDAVINSVKAYLIDTNFDLTGKKVVWVSDERVYYSGTQWVSLPMHDYEASPYASVYKYSHDVAPAKGALGAKGCNDCHSFNSSFWKKPVLIRLFDDNGNPRYQSNAVLLGTSQLAVLSGGLRQEILKPILFYGLLIGAASLLLILISGKYAFNLEIFGILPTNPEYRLMSAVLGTVFLGPMIIILCGEFLPSYTIGILQNVHKWIGIGLIPAALWLLTKSKGQGVTSLFRIGIIGVIYMAITGIILFVSDSQAIRQIVFTLHDIGAVFLTALALGAFIFSFLKVGGMKKRGLAED